MGLWAFYQDHKSLLCKVAEPVAECAFSLARLGVFAFFGKYRDRKKHMETTALAGRGREE
jgi:hypothetical protein